MSLLYCKFRAVLKDGKAAFRLVFTSDGVGVGVVSGVVRALMT